MVDGHATDTLVSLAASPRPLWGWLYEMESSVQSVGPASALMQKIILSALRERGERAAKGGDYT